MVDRSVAMGRPMSDAVVVCALGMHRSGSSAIACLLKLALLDDAILDR